MQYAALVSDIGGVGTYAVVRYDRGVIWRWQPATREWIEAAWNVDEIYGSEKRFSRDITEEEAQALIKSGTGLVQLSEQTLRDLSARR